MSFRNRCVIVGSNGLINLSVPLEKGRGQKLLMKDVRISYRDNWQAQHWRTIESCYSRAPFYEFYCDGCRELLNPKHEFLLDLDIAIFEWLIKVLKYPGAFSLTESYLPSFPDSITDMRNRLLPKNADPSGLPIYTQVFEDRIGFQPDLSILDLLFCTGPESTHLLQAAL